MKGLLNRMEQQLQAGFPFAVYSKPGSNTVSGIFQKNALTHYADDFNGEGFVFAPFAGNNPFFIPATASDILMVKNDPREFILSDHYATGINSNARDAFEALVAKSVNAINNGDFQKLVVSRKEIVELERTVVSSIFSRLLHAYPNAFRYCFFHPETGLWAGATPEQLLKIENNTLYTVALAGTQIYKEEGETLWESKEIQEQQFVTDYIIDSLQPYTDTIIATAPYTFRAGNLVHIKTDISVNLQGGSNLQNIVEILHPTPAVCGLPKEQAKKFLLENEGYNREYYSGFLGELNRDFTTGDVKTDLFVNLRCMKIENNTASLYIGCGITKDSDPGKEFMETVNKSITMKRIL